MSPRCRGTRYRELRPKMPRFDVLFNRGILDVAPEVEISVGIGVRAGHRRIERTKVVDPVIQRITLSHKTSGDFNMESSLKSVVQVVKLYPENQQPTSWFDEPAVGLRTSTR